MNKYELIKHFPVLNMLMDEDKKLILELVERATPKKVYRKNYGTAYCPVCNNTADFVVNHLQYETPFCRTCGQALDWSDKE